MDAHYCSAVWHGTALRRSLSGCLAVVLAVAGTAHAAPSVALSVSGEPEATQILHESMNNTIKLRQSLSQMLFQSTEDMKSLKSLLTTNAKGTKALNDMLLEMDALTARMGRFDGAMEQCRQQLLELQARDAEGSSSQDADDPLLGGAALLQLRGHAERLQKHLAMAKHKLLPRHLGP
mmetsp:Transcript_90673/g.270614  ORF Transcript_90673/g.270614 Transcript_90673/m.270614 type:complete len:178 (+) Transcript_90673:120-653(+)